MKRAILILRWFVMSCFALAGCKPNVVTKGNGQMPDSSAVPGTTGPRVRTALVIGNTRYQKLPRLDACKHDAEVMAQIFQKIGIPIFQGKPLLDLTTDQMDAAVADYAHSLGRDSEAFIYYSGHGAQIGGSNYLLPVNFDAQYEKQARRQAIALDDILETLEKTDAQLRVVILDACRDPGEFLAGEPVQKGITRSKGLNEPRVDAPETLVCFATKHGTAALADDTSSFYSRVLAEEILKPVRIDDVLRTVARRVYEATEKRQLPFTYGSLLQDHYFVTPVTPASVATLPTLTPGPMKATPSPLPIQRAINIDLTKPSLAVVDAASSPLGNPASPVNASKEHPFVNSLGMKFVSVPGTTVLFSIWATRVQDYAAYAQEKGISQEKPNFKQEPTHPVVKVSWEDAKAFCRWLSEKEGRAYRLPTDSEWSVAIGLYDEKSATPYDKSLNGPSDIYPWGTQWPPPKGAGNFADQTAKRFERGFACIDGYDDGYACTSPVGSFTANRYGLYDMSGNVFQWCEDWYTPQRENRVLRGISWNRGLKFNLRSSQRYSDSPTASASDYGFRCVLTAPGG